MLIMRITATANDNAKVD